LGQSLYIKGLALEQLHNNKSSIQIFQDVLKHAVKNHYPDLEMKALDKLSAIYAKTGDYKAAVFYATTLQIRKDSNVITHQRVLSKSLPGKADLQKREVKMKQLLADNSVLDNNLRSNLRMIDNQGKWILFIVIGYTLIFLAFIIFKRQNKLILIKNQDLTDRMHALETGKLELEHTRYKAEESDRLKSAFLGNISYEIRSPLNAIVSFSGFLRQKEKPENERRKYIEVIHQYSQSLLSLIIEIFDVARIESGEIKQTSEVIDINHFLGEIQNQYCEDNNSEVHNDLKLMLNLPSLDSPFTFKTYPERLKNVLHHLIENALKCSEYGKVEIGYLIKGEYIEFYVRDDGKGLPNKKIDDIFERFRTTNDFPKPESGPLGLGLTISKNFIESMGGHIWVTSNNDNGSTFFFTLPLQMD